RAERRRGLARARLAHDEDQLLLDAAVLALDRRELRAGVEHEAALAEDLRVQHAEAALLRLAEIVAAEDAGHVAVDVDQDRAILVLALGRTARGVDDLELRLPVRELGRVR